MIDQKLDAFIAVKDQVTIKQTIFNLLDEIQVSLLAQNVLIAYNVLLIICQHTAILLYIGVLYHITL